MTDDQRATEELTEGAIRPLQRLLLGDESELYEQLGLRIRAVAADPAVAGNFDPPIHYDGTTMGPLDEVRDLGVRLFRRWNVEAYSLICGVDHEDSSTRSKLVNAFGVSDAMVGAAVASVLVSTAGLAPTVAVVIAALVVKRFLQPTYEEFCGFWQEHLR